MAEAGGIDVLKWVNSSIALDMRANLPQRIYDAVLTKIFLGEIEFGQRIRESLITKELQVSNVPVREAFIRLREEGWLKAVPNCGCKVVDYHDIEKHRELYYMRLSLETGVYYCLAQKIGDDQVSVLEDVVGGIEKAQVANNATEYRKLDAEFHMKAVFFAGGERLWKIYRPIFLQWCIMVQLNQESGEVSQSLTEVSCTHRALVEALKTSDSNLAAELIRDHFILPYLE